MKDSKASDGKQSGQREKQTSKKEKRKKNRVAKSTAQLVQCATRGEAAYCTCVECHVILRVWPCRRALAVSEGGATGDTLTTFNPLNYIYPHKEYLIMLRILLFCSEICLT